MNWIGQVTVVALGPLTNLALAINLDPTFLTSIKELWLMGGNISGKANFLHVSIPFSLLSWKTYTFNYIDH